VAVRPALAAFSATISVSLCSFTLAGEASAHILPFPGHVPSGGIGVVQLAGPNERDVPMTGLAVTVPQGVRIVAARPNGKWRGVVDGDTATWSGGTLAPDKATSFFVELEATLEPGPVQLQADQLYPNGEVASWPVALTVLPGPDEAPQNLRGAIVVLVVGLVLVVAFVLLLRRRYARSLQER
jgi:hypothetical protein